MQTADKDVLDLLDHTWERLWNRMAGLTDREWSWRPVDADDKITIRWRLFHIAEVLTQSRNWTWLAVTPPEAKLDNGGADCARMPWPRWTRRTPPSASSSPSNPST